MRSLSFVLLALLAFTAFPQPGTNDPTFNVNDDGTWGPGPNGPVIGVVQQTDGKIIILGGFDRVHGVAYNHMARMNINGTVDASFSTGTGFTDLSPGLPRAMALQPDGRIVVVGDFLHYNGTAITRVLRLLPDGSLDPSFDPGTGPDGIVQDVRILPDGRILITGDFFTVRGTARPHIAMLLADGSLDPSFAPVAGANDEVWCAAVQADGRVLIGGEFTFVEGVARSCIARLNVNGTLDATFNPGSGVQGIAPGEGYGPRVDDILVQPDGNIVVVGAFSQYNGTAQGCIFRVLPSGSLDPSFNTGGGNEREISSCDIRPDGSILLGGLFMSYGGESGVALLNADGSVDPSFVTGFHTNAVYGARFVSGGGKIIAYGDFRNFALEIPISGLELLQPDGAIDWTFHRGSGFNASPTALAVMPDNRILVAGEHTRYNGAFVPKIIRLLEDGERDLSYPIGSGPNGNVRGMKLMSDGRLMIFGGFTQVNGTPRAGLARLNADGSLDASFDPGTGALPGNPVFDLEVMDDGKVVIVGSFTEVNGTSRTGVARLHGDGSLDAAFNPVVVDASDAPSVRAVVVSQAPDNRIWIGGEFTEVNGVARANMACLTESGALDLSFDPGAGHPSGVIEGIARSSGGELYIWGHIIQYDGTPLDLDFLRALPNGDIDPSFMPLDYAQSSTNGIMVLNTGQIVLGGRYRYDGATETTTLISLLPNGLPDPAFVVQTGGGFSTNCLDLQTNCCSGKIIIAGNFNTFDGVPRNHIARVNNDASVRMIGRMFLEGPWAGTFMQASLGPAGMLPLDEPFTGLGFEHVGSGGGEHISPIVFQQQGPDAIVDWVFVELRNPQNPSQVFATRSGLLKSDGGIVDVDGQSSLEFKDVSNGGYYIAIRHRNHLGAMTGQPQLLLYLGSFVDFTSPNMMLYGSNAMRIVGNDRMLWAGDVNRDGALKYTGPSNDRDPILVSVGGGTPNNSVTGYKLEDINLDGVVKYTGQNNDRDPILVNVGGSTPNNTRQEQLP